MASTASEAFLVSLHFAKGRWDFNQLANFLLGRWDVGRLPHFSPLKAPRFFWASQISPPRKPLGFPPGGCLGT